MIEKYKTLLPLEKLRKLYEEKMRNSALFRHIIDVVTCPDLMALIEDAKQSAQIQEQLEILRKHDIDVVKILALLGY